MTSNKKRKYGDLSARPTPNSDPDLLEDVFQAFTGRRPAPPTTTSEPEPPTSIQSRQSIPYRETIPYQKTRQYRRDTVPENDTVSEIGTVKNRITDPWLDQGHMKVSNYVSDVIAPHLTPTQWAIYYRLYRLSYGWGKDDCLVGNKRLREMTKVKETAIREAITDLRELKLIEILEIVNTAEVKGTRYKVNVFLPADTVSENDTVSAKDTVSRKSTVPPNGPNKRHDHDDDLKRKDHHQSAPVENSGNQKDAARSETMMIASTLYESLTGRPWTASDEKAFEKVSHLPSTQIEQLMRTIHARAGEPIGSFAYFAKAILVEVAGKGTQSSAGLKKKYEKLIREIREIHVGASDYHTSDLIHDLKSRCAREGVAWSDNTANELLGM